MSLLRILRVRAAGLIAAAVILPLLSSCNDDTVIPPSKPEVPVLVSISGTVTDSLAGNVLDKTEVIVDGTDFSALTSSDGSFSLTGIPKQSSYSLSFRTTGYVLKQVTISTKDTAVKDLQVTMHRRTFNYGLLDFSEMPDFNGVDPDLYYTQVFFHKRHSFEFGGPYWDSTEVTRFIDSVMIAVLRSGADLHALWFQSYMSQCSHPAISYTVTISLLMKSKSYLPSSLGFEHYKPGWSVCPQKPMQYRIYSKFN